MTIILAFDLLMSVVAFVLYAWDKRAAKRRRRRVPERVLHLVALSGGWPGAPLGQRLLRHKTAKASFRRVFWGTVALNTTATVVFVVLERGALVPLWSGM